MRCIYSPAAAEKVDLHSLNNRLIQVEALLTLMTAGKTPPPFLSTYPLAQLPLSSAPLTHRQQQPKSVTAMRPQITPGTASSSISVSMTDLNSIWLAHCQLGVDLGRKKSVQKLEPASDSSNCYIKLEPSLMDALHPHIIEQPSSSTGVTHSNLPPLSVYYSPLPTPQTSNSSYPSANPYPDFTNSYPYPSPFGSQSEFSAHTHTSAPPPAPSSSSPASSSVSIPASNTSSTPSCAYPLLPAKKPHPTPSLVALLPAPPTRTRLLHRVRAAHPELAVLVPWDRVLDLSADQEEVRDREREREREKKTQLAKTIFFGARGESSSQPHPRLTSGYEVQEMPPTLPLFVVLCYLLALGAWSTSIGAGERVDKTFLYALAGQAMGVWESYRPPQVEHDHDPGHEQDDKHEWGFEEEETTTSNVERDTGDLDYVLACLMQIAYLVQGSRKGVGVGMKGMFPLVGCPFLFN